MISTKTYDNRYYDVIAGNVRFAVPDKTCRSTTNSCAVSRATIRSSI